MLFQHPENRPDYHPRNLSKAIQHRVEASGQHSGRYPVRHGTVFFERIRRTSPAAATSDFLTGVYSIVLSATIVSD